MPYPSEHSARLQSPSRFDPDSFRRTNGGTLYGRIKVPASIAIIWGKLKSANKPSDFPIPQALRFKKSSWTVEQAKKWLEGKNITAKSFEGASE